MLQRRYQPSLLIAAALLLAPPAFAQTVESSEEQPSRVSFQRPELRHPAKDEPRAVWLAPWVDSLWQDVRHGVRALRRSPALVAVSALSLGAAIGINVLLYMAVTAIYGHQPSMIDPEQVVGVEPGNGRQFSFPDYRDLQRSGIFAGAAGFRRTPTRR